MSKLIIMLDIETIVGYKYSSWYIGVTDNLERRKDEHGDPPNWDEWVADSEDDARSIERHFVDKGMNGDTGGGKNPDKVYIFKSTRG